MNRRRFLHLGALMGVAPALSLAQSAAKIAPNKFGAQSTAEDITAGLDLSVRTILVTGCNSGLGLELTADYLV